MNNKPSSPPRSITIGAPAADRRDLYSRLLRQRALEDLRCGPLSGMEEERKFLQLLTRRIERADKSGPASETALLVLARFYRRQGYDLGKLGPGIEAALAELLPEIKNGRPVEPTG